MSPNSLSRSRARLVALEEREQRIRDAHERHRRKRLHLSWEQAAAGHECHGCRVPLLTESKFKRSDESTLDDHLAVQKVRDAFHVERHPDCIGPAWTWGRNTSWHCYVCCPQPPSDPDVIAKARLSFARAVERSGPQHMHQVEHTCGHTTKVSTSIDTKSVTGTRHCHRCGVIRAVVSSSIVGSYEVETRSRLHVLDQQINEAERQERAAMKQASKLAEEAARLRRELAAQRRAEHGGAS